MPAGGFDRAFDFLVARIDAFFGLIIHHIYLLLPLVLLLPIAWLALRHFFYETKCLGKPRLCIMNCNLPEGHDVFE